METYLNDIGYDIQHLGVNHYTIPSTHPLNEIGKCNIRNRDNMGMVLWSNLKGI